MAIAAFLILIISYIISLFIIFEELAIGVQNLAGEIDEKFYWLILIGFVAQLIDGLLKNGIRIVFYCGTVGYGAFFHQWQYSYIYVFQWSSLLSPIEKIW